MGYELLGFLTGLNIVSLYREVPQRLVQGLENFRVIVDQQRKKMIAHFVLRYVIDHLLLTSCCSDSEVGCNLNESRFRNHLANICEVPQPDTTPCADPNHSMEVKKCDNQV